jgi:pyruvate dehydrogenase E1 component alpha subunit
MEAYLKRKRVLTKAVRERIAEEAEAVAAAMREGLARDDDPEPAELFAHVFAEPTPQLAEQAAVLADELSRDEPSREGH